MLSRQKLLEKYKMIPRTKRWLILAVMLLIVGGAGIYVWNKMKSNANAFVSGNGRLEATEVDIAAKIEGRIQNIFVNEGDFVQTGQLLVQMNVDVLTAQLNEAKALVAQRESELVDAKKRLARTKELEEQEFAAVQDLDNDEANEEVANAALIAAKAAVASIEADIEDSALKSPCDGRIQYKISQVGEVLAAGGKVLSLVDLSDVYMTFFLPEKLAGRVAIGSEVHLILDTAPNNVIPAKIAYVSDVAQFTPKTVETADDREKLMFRVKAQISRELVNEHLTQIKSGLPGVAWIKLDPQAQWPKELIVNVKIKEKDA